MRTIYTWLLTFCILICVAISKFIPSYLLAALSVLAVIAVVSAIDTAVHTTWTLFNQVSWGCSQVEDGLFFVKANSRRGRPTSLTWLEIPHQNKKEIQRRTGSRWGGYPLTCVFDGGALLLREVKIPPVSRRKSADLLHFELEYQFAWYNSDWVISTTNFPSLESDSLLKVMVAFLKREELLEQYAKLDSMGLKPNSIELRTTAQLRASRPLLISPDCLIWEVDLGIITCSFIEQGVLTRQLQLPVDAISLLSEEVRALLESKFSEVLYIAKNCDATSVQVLRENLVREGILIEEGRILTAQEVVLHYFPEDRSPSMTKAPQAMLALGMALQEAKDAL